MVRKLTILISTIAILVPMFTGCVSTKALSSTYEQMPALNQNTEYVNIDESAAKLDGKVVFLDPGHGFSDGGTISPAGSGYNLTESAVVFDICLRIKQILSANKISVVMSRTTDQDEKQKDKYVLLKVADRVKAANDINASVFVSVHVDSYENDKSIRGTSIYYCKKDDDYNAKSEKLAKKIIDGYVARTGDSKAPVLTPMNRRGSYYVNRAAKMPSVLFEVGFITNTQDEANFASDDWKQKTAQGIADGILKYFS